jgi:O-antigen ligase
MGEVSMTTGAHAYEMRQPQIGMLWLLLTLAFCFTAQLFGAAILQFGIIGLAVAGFALLFAAKPSLVPTCIVGAVAGGGVELQVSASTPKLFFATVLVAAYILSVAVRSALWREQPAGSANSWIHGHRSRDGGIAICAILYLILMLPSLSQMLVPQRSEYLIAMRVIILVGVVALAREKRILGSSYDLLLATSVVGSIIAATYCVNAVKEYGAGNIGELALGLAAKDNTVQVGLLGTTNTIASFLCFTLPLSVGFILLPNVRFRMRGLAALGILIQAFALLGTASRGGLLAFVGGVALVALLGSRSVRDLPRLLRFVGLGVVIAVAAYFVMGEAIRERLSGSLARNMVGYYLVRRAQLWLSSWRAFTSNPIFGIGIGNIGFFDRDYGTGDGSETHNLVLQTLAEEGVFAATILIVLLWKLFSRSIRATRTGGSTRMWIASALAAALIDSLIEPTFWAPSFAALFWIVAVFFYRNSLNPPDLRTPDDFPVPPLTEGNTEYTSPAGVRRPRLQ